MPNDVDLIQRAVKARTQAYCPYSDYSVGAAVLGADGRVYTGCNVENASFGLTLCAERAALAAMVSEGCRKADALAVATRDGVAPCGACRQFIAEFCDDLASVRVFVVDEANQVTAFTLAELLPHGFGKDSLR